MQIKLIILDFDGTLATTEEANMNAYVLALREEGYGYAIIGGAGPVDYYKKVCGAEIIEGSIPGIYKDLI